jgi:hypothetical protein
MKRFLFLSYGFEKPSPEVMGAWQQWFASIADRTVDQGGLWSGGREVTTDGATELPFGPDAITGYLIFTADDIDDAERIVRDCPVVASNRVYEIMAK